MTTHPFRTGPALALFVSLFISCAPRDLRPISEYIYPIRDSVVIYHSMPLYPYTGNEADYYTSRDSLHSSMVLVNDYGEYYQVDLPTGPVWFYYGDALPTYEYNVWKQPIPVFLPSADHNTIWNRAVEFIVRHSDVRIEMINPSLIQTYNPPPLLQDGYSVTQIPYRDTIEYHPRFFGTRHLPNRALPADMYAKRLAYFMATGVDRGSRVLDR